VKHSILISLLTCCALTGCYRSFVTLAPQYPDSPWQPCGYEEPLSCAAPKFELPPHSAPRYYNEEWLVDQDHEYNLAELIDLALRSNPKTRIAWEEAKQAAFDVGLTVASYLPQISADILTGYQHTPVPLPTALVPSGQAVLDTTEFWPSLVIKWLLFDFGKRDYLIEAAMQRSYASNVAFTQAHQKLIFEVTKAYFDLNAARTQLHVAEQALKNTEILQDAAESKRERGLEKVTEVAFARRETAKARFELEKAKADDNDAYYNLLEAMGLTPTLKLQVVDSSGRALPKGLAADVNTYICQALQQRPDIIEAFAKLRATKADVGSAEASFRPTINLDTFVYQGISSLRTGTGHTTWVNRPASAFFIEFKFPLYDGGMRWNELNKACSKNAAAKEELRRIQNEAIRQVARAYDLVKSTLAEYESALALVEAADIAYDSAIDSYRQGVGTFTDAISANTEKVQAQSTLANAYATVLTAGAALAFSAGELTSIDALDSSRDMPPHTYQFGNDDCDK